MRSSGLTPGPPRSANPDCFGRCYASIVPQGPLAVNRPRGEDLRRTSSTREPRTEARAPPGRARDDRGPAEEDDPAGLSRSSSAAAVRAGSTSTCTQDRRRAADRRRGAGAERVGEVLAGRDVRQRRAGRMWNAEIASPPWRSGPRRAMRMHAASVSYASSAATTASETTRASADHDDAPRIEPLELGRDERLAGPFGASAAAGPPARAACGTAASASGQFSPLVT